MKLSDKIMQERKKQGWSQEELGERLEVSRQSVSKWESGLSIPDLDKIIAMSELFGVTTDYLLKEAPMHVSEAAPEETDGETASPKKEPLRHASREEVETYLRLNARLSWRIAFGVMLCILSPVALILLCGFADAGLLQEMLAVGIGLLTLFLLVGCAVAIFILNGMRLSACEFLGESAVAVDEAVLADVQKRHDKYEKTHRICITVGTLFCIFSCIPLVLVSILWQNGIAVLSMVGVLLAMVSVGVLLFVRTGMIMGGYQRILQIGDYTPAEIKQKTRREAIKDALESAFWLIVVAIYLLVSFSTGAWHLTWLIFIGGAAISTLLDLLLQIFSKKED